jgi:hypothetical protein
MGIESSYHIILAYFSCPEGGASIHAVDLVECEQVGDTTAMVRKAMRSLIQKTLDAAHQPEAALLEAMLDQAAQDDAIEIGPYTFEHLQPGTLYTGAIDDTKRIFRPDDDYTAAWIVKDTDDRQVEMLTLGSYDHQGCLDRLRKFDFLVMRDASLITLPVVLSSLGGLTAMTDAEWEYVRNRRAYLPETYPLGVDALLEHVPPTTESPS